MSSTQQYLSNPAKFLKQNYEKLKSWPKISLFDIRDLLRSGLTYNGDGHHDLLQCMACGMEIELKPGDDPCVAHKTLYPECLYIQEVKVEKKLSKNSPVHEDMMTFPSRYLSFQTWPNAIAVDLCELADAGFFYYGVADEVICHYCGGMLKNLENDFWMEHAHWFPECYYVELVQGKDFVDRAVADRKSPRVTNSEAFAESIEMMSKNCIYCNDKKIEVVFSPCGHLVSCDDCSKYQITCKCGASVLDSCKVLKC